jgi:hypothetical protein
MIFAFVVVGLLATWLGGSPLPLIVVAAASYVVWRVVKGLGE